MSGVNLSLLSEKISESGLKKQYIADKMSLTRNGLDNKISGRNGFYAEEISNIAKIINLSGNDVMNIFFADIVDKTSTSPKENDNGKRTKS